MVAYLPGSTKPTPQSLAQAPVPNDDLARRRAMKAAWKAYRGEFVPPLKVEDGQPDDNVLSNRCAPIVDKGVSFLFGQVVKIELPHGTQAQKDYIEGLFGDDDDRMTTFAQAAINGGVCGQPFYKLLLPEGQMPYPRVVVLNPEVVRIVTDPEDCSLVLAYIIEYPAASGALFKRQVIARIDPDNEAGVAGEYDLDDTWSIATYARIKDTADWQQSGPVLDWPYPFAPIFCNQNLPNPNEAWGVPDLTPDIIETNKDINFVQSNLSRIIKYHGHPITYATGVRAKEVTLDINGMMCLPDPSSKIEKLAPMDNFGGILSFLASLRDNMDEQSRVPAVALGRQESLPKGNISGVALELLFQPIIEKTVQKQRLYGKCIRELCRAALVVGGLLSLEDYPAFPVNLHFPNLLPIDDLAAAQTAQILINIGVSEATVLQELGYNPDDEAEKVAKEAQQKLTAFAKGQGMPPALPAVDTPAAQTAVNTTIQQDAQQQKAAGEA